MRKTIVFAAASVVAIIATAEVVYTYENDSKTYVATVKTAETSISDEAIAVLDRNEITNFVIRGDKPLVVDKGSSFPGDVRLENSIRLAADNALGIAPGVITTGRDRLITLAGATVRKKIEMNLGESWSKYSGFSLWAGNSVFKEKVFFTMGNFNVYPYVNSYTRFEGGMDGGGYLYFREASGGTVEFTGVPVDFSYPISVLNGRRTANSDYGFHLVFSVAGNKIVAVGNKSVQANRFTCSKLSTTVDWAFDNASQRIEFGCDSLWDLCGTSQRVGHLNINRLNYENKEGPLSVITNSSAATLAKLYLNPAENSTPQVVFGGRLSVDFAGSKTTTLDYPSSASGHIAVNGGALVFTGNGSWRNAEKITISDGAAVAIASGNVFGPMAEIQLDGSGILSIAAGEGGTVVTQTVGFLTVDGVAREHGFYEMGEGVLEVLYNGRRELSECLLRLEDGEVFRLDDHVMCDRFDKITLGDGAVLEILTSEYFVDDAAFTLNLGEDSKLILGEGIGIYVASGTVAGKNLAPGRYTSSDVEWLKGSGTIYVPYGAIAGTQVDWTAGGSDTLMTNSDNWSDTVNLSDGSVYAVFASGYAATVVGNTFLNGVFLNGSGAFEIGAAGENALLRLASGGITVSGTGQRSISSPIKVDGDQIWQVGTELKLTGSISSDPLAKYAVRKNGSAELILRNDSDFAGDIYLDDGGIRLENGMTLGNGSGKVIVGPRKTFTLYGATLDKDVFFNNNDSSDWNRHALACWAGLSTVNGKLTFGNRNLDVYFWKGSDIVFKGGIEDADSANSGYFRLRPGAGKLTIEGSPVKLKHSMAIKPEGFDSAGSAGVITFAVAGNELPGIGRDNGLEDFRLNQCILKTTVDWAFDNAGKTMMLGHDTIWDLCGTVQRVGRLDTKELAGCKPTVVTNSSERPALLYVNQTKNSTPWIDFAGDLSVDFSGNFTTVVNRAMTAKGDLSVNSGILTFEDGGSWRNAENIDVNGSAKMTIAESGVFHRTANMSLASETSLDIASGVAMRVASLTIGGVEMPFGDYRFGSGTLSVGPVAMRIIVR